MKLGVDCLIENATALRKLRDRKVALLAHPASMTGNFQHSMEALTREANIRLAAAFGPQHGLRGDKQDNMVESENYVDPVLNIPIFSLYGQVRRPTASMMGTFDVLLIDVQDVGCRIYTFLTTLFYLLEDCAKSGKSLWVLDRPNPAGRPVEGPALVSDYESFVGAATIPMRHGLTLGEAANWYVKHKGLNLDLNVVKMAEYDPKVGPGYGWPLTELPWVNPSPNIANLNAVRAYVGTVLLEGTTLSEGRGTTRPLEMVGAPDLDVDAILLSMQRLAPQWLQGCRIRRCYFEPTFHKHVGKLCTGFQIHTDYPEYNHHACRPFRLIALFLKVLRTHYPEYEIWREFEYEYVTDRLAIDVINGSDFLRQWVDDAESTIADLEHRLKEDERLWIEQSTGFYLYR